MAPPRKSQDTEITAKTTKAAAGTAQASRLHRRSAIASIGKTRDIATQPRSRSTACGANSMYGSGPPLRGKRNGIRNHSDQVAMPHSSANQPRRGNLRVRRLEALRSSVSVTLGVASSGSWLDMALSSANVISRLPRFGDFVRPPPLLSTRNPLGCSFMERGELRRSMPGYFERAHVLLHRTPIDAELVGAATVNTIAGHENQGAGLVPWIRSSSH